MKTYIKTLWEEKPLQLIIFIALILRLIAALFSQGYAMHDDHFLVIEASQSWVDGDDYNKWLPSSGATTPSGHSFFYVGIHYILFSLMKLIGFTSPVGKMYVIRILHALFSIIVVSLGFKITEKISNVKSARMVALLMAVFWFMPFLSVRNLVEIVCIPFLFIGIWMIINAKEKKRYLLWILLAGFVLGLSISVRYQLIIFVGGVGLAMLIKKQVKEAFVMGFGAIFSFVLVQGGIDSFTWGYPFAEFIEYVKYNLAHKNEYGSGGWYKYLLFISGILIPPISILLWFGFFRQWKKHLLIFLPSLLFLAFHSYFPNKQERFVLPIVPFIIMLGIIGWNEFKDGSKFWNKNKWLLNSFWIFFWSLNMLVLPILTVTYTKKSRVESMSYLSKYDDIAYLVVEDTNNGGATLIPRYYLGQWAKFYNFSSGKRIDKFPKSVLENPDNKGKNKFILFYEAKNLNKRVEEAKAVFPNLKFEAEIEPGFIDVVMHNLNPKNKNKKVFIYKIND